MAACNGYDVNLQSRLAVAIQLQGRKQDADAIWNEIATRFETNGTPDEQAVAARALINAAENAASPNYERAFKILVRVLGTSPNNAKARLEYARLLMDDFPSARDVNIADVPSDPVALLEPIVEQNPTRLYFAMLHVEAIYQRLQKKLQDDAPVDDATIAHALEHADKLFTRFANHPGVAFLAFRTRRACLKRDPPPPHFIREHGRFDEFCLSIFNAPDIPEQDKASILESQLDRLADLIDWPRMFKRNAQIVRNELDKFTGQRAEEFEERYRNLRAKVPDEAFPRFPPMRRHRPFRFPFHDADENP